MGLVGIENWLSVVARYEGYFWFVNRTTDHKEYSFGFLSWLRIGFLNLNYKQIQPLVVLFMSCRMLS